jgi:hypothetical protein
VVRCQQQLTPELAADLAAVQRVLFLDAWLGPVVSWPGPWQEGGGANRPLHPVSLPLQLQEIGAPDGPGRSPQIWAGTATWIGASHGLSPPDLLALSQVLFGCSPRAHQLLLPARCFGHGQGLSPALVKRLAEARSLIETWIAAGSPLQDGGHA